MSNDILFLDAETYYDVDYSLRKMSPAEYILDRRFEEIMWAVRAIKADGTEIPHQVIDGPDFPVWLSQFDPNKTTTITFNALFDNAILAWHHGFVPHTMLCSMSMARALLGHKLVRYNLASVADFLGFPPKQTTIANVIGMRRADIQMQPFLWQDFKVYAQHDNELSEAIFWKLKDKLPFPERRLMDLVLRCCIEPRFVVNTQLLYDHVEQVKLDKETMLRNAGNIDKKDVMSSKKFQQALEALGVIIEYKTTALGNPAPAFAKGDAFMERLQNDPDPAVAALATARIGLKSTLEETRSQRFWNIGQLPWAVKPDGMPRLYSGGTMPMPLAYGAAHTHRLAGDWKMNVQNMPRPKKDANGRDLSKLRYSLEAPPDHTVLTIDLGQIEARMVAWLCKETKLLEEFAQYDKGDKTFDPYNRLGTAIFGVPVNRKSPDPVQQVMGFIGKTGILGLGYACGKDKFHSMILTGARAMGIDLAAVGYTREIGDKAVNTYRNRYSAIPRGWQALDMALQEYWLKPGPWALKFGPCVIKHGEVTLPSGLSLLYANPVGEINAENMRREFYYRHGNIRHKIYGAKLLENISQALARVIVTNAALRIRDRGRYKEAPHAYRFVLQAHDELVYIIPNNILDEAKAIIHAEMVRPPSWGKDIPLVADVGTGKSYGAAK